MVDFQSTATAAFVQIHLMHFDVATILNQSKSIAHYGYVKCSKRES